MAEPYSDESAFTNEEMTTIARLQRERDEARQVARTLAILLAPDVGGGLELEPHEAASLEKAFAYPKVPHG